VGDCGRVRKVVKAQSVIVMSELEDIKRAIEAENFGHEMVSAWHIQRTMLAIDKKIHELFSVE
jgi:hypothetical protein